MKAGQLGSTEIGMTLFCKSRCAQKGSWTALVWASSEGHLGVVRALLAAGVDKEAKCDVSVGFK